MVPLYAAEATVTGGRRGRAHVGQLDLPLRVPTELGGPGGPGTDPEELFAAGYGACFQSALGVVARKRRVVLGESVVRAQVTVSCDQDGLWILSVALHVALLDLDQAVAEELVASAHATCPYSRAVQGNIAVTTKVSARRAG